MMTGRAMGRGVRDDVEEESKGVRTATTIARYQPTKRRCEAPHFGTPAAASAPEIALRTRVTMSEVDLVCLAVRTDICAIHESLTPRCPQVSTCTQLRRHSQQPATDRQEDNGGGGGAAPHDAPLLHTTPRPRANVSLANTPAQHSHHRRGHVTHGPSLAEWIA
eukprot:1486027-Rhodomonas_salina.3